MKLKLKRAAFLTVIATLLVAAPTFAQVDGGITDTQATRIRANCQSALVTLGQIHANDAPAYINRNQTYFSISDKLMARLNSRLTINSYDTTALVKTSSDYNNELGKFRDAYKTYDDSMNDVLSTDCNKDPGSFYNKVAAARTARQGVKDDVDQLTTLINQYQQEVQQFENQHFPTQPEVPKS